MGLLIDPGKGELHPHLRKGRRWVLVGSSLRCKDNTQRSARYVKQEGVVFLYPKKKKYEGVGGGRVVEGSELPKEIMIGG